MINHRTLTGGLIYPFFLPRISLSSVTRYQRRGLICYHDFSKIMAWICAELERKGLGVGNLGTENGHAGIRRMETVVA